MFVLGIETSCDETSLALLKSSNTREEILEKSFLDRVNSFEIVDNLVSSQIEKHSQFGGVVPEIGAREHLLSIFELLENLNHKNSKFLSKLDQICVTTTPGLASALRVGIDFSKALEFFLKNNSSFTQKVKLCEVNHLHGHIVSCFYNQEKLQQNPQNISKNTLVSSLKDLSKPFPQIFPHLHLLVSGGNTQLILIKKWGEFEIVGQTLDDAVGECFDKVGRMLGLPYPGGVNIAKICDLEDFNYCNLPIGMKNKTLDFSYSGLKTATKYFLQEVVLDYKEKKISEELLKKTLEYEILNQKNPKNSGQKLDINQELIKKTCVSIQSVAISQLINKLKLGIQKFKPRTIGISGGVSANLLLRKKVNEVFEEQKIFYPDQSLTGDNAVMIALAGILNNYI